MGVAGFSGHHPRTNRYYRLAQAWLIVTLSGSSSAFYLGLDSFAGELPILLFTPIGGVVADRRDRRHMMLRRRSSR